MVENFVKLKVHKILGRIKKPLECGNGDPGRVETEKAWAPQKSPGQRQRHTIARQKNEVFQFRKRPLDRRYPFHEGACDCEPYGSNAIRVLECGHDIAL